MPFEIERFEPEIVPFEIEPFEIPDMVPGSPSGAPPERAEKSALFVPSSNARESWCSTSALISARVLAKRFETKLPMSFGFTGSMRSR